MTTADSDHLLEEAEGQIMDLRKEVQLLKQENELFRKALLEVEAEKSTMAYNQLGTSLKIRMLLQQPDPSATG